MSSILVSNNQIDSEGNGAPRYTNEEIIHVARIQPSKSQYRQKIQKKMANGERDPDQ